MILRSTRCVLCLLLLLGSGCGPEAEPEEAANDFDMDVADRGTFGDPYEIVTNFTPADPDRPPALEGDSLFALLLYGGGCEDHSFDLEYRIEQDTARLWIHHNARGDDCESLLQDEAWFEVPRAVQEAAVVELLNPQGGPAHVVRWGRP